MGSMDFLLYALLTIEKIGCFVINFNCTLRVTIDILCKFKEVTIYSFVFKFSKESIMPNRVKCLLEVNKTCV